MSDNPQGRRDARTFWRVALAIVAPVPWLALAAATIITPDGARDDDAQAYAAIAAHTARAGAALPLDGLFIMTLMPAIVAILVACRRSAPTATAWIGAITLIGAAAGPLAPTNTLIDYVGIRHGLAKQAVLAINDGIGSLPVSGVVLVLFLLGVILGGRILLGVLEWRSRTVPRWMAVVLILSAPLDVFGPSGLVFHNDGAFVSYLMTALAFGAASWTLFRTRNGDFDVPPADPETVTGLTEVLPPVVVAWTVHASAIMGRARVPVWLRSSSGRAGRNRFAAEMPARPVRMRRLVATAG